MPTKLKVLRGNPGKRALPKHEPEPVEGEIKCPSTLKGRARTFWKRHEPILKAMGVLTTADVEMMAVLCETEAEFWAARDDVRKNGTRLQVYTEGGSKWVSNPSVTQASDAGKRLKALMVEFGMSPSSRTRIAVKAKVEEDDPFARFEQRA